jgi:hypothetical protein
MSKFVNATIRRRLFMIFQRDMPFQVRHEYKLDRPRWELSHMQVIPGPTPGVIPIYHLRETDYEYHRFPTLISAARYVKSKKDLNKK